MFRFNKNAPNLKFIFLMILLLFSPLTLYANQQIEKLIIHQSPETQSCNSLIPSNEDPTNANEGVKGLLKEDLKTIRTLKNHLHTYHNWHIALGRTLFNLKSGLDFSEYIALQLSQWLFHRAPRSEYSKPLKQSLETLTHSLLVRKNIVPSPKEVTVCYHAQVIQQEKGKFSDFYSIQTNCNIAAMTKILTDTIPKQIHANYQKKRTLALGGFGTLDLGNIDTKMDVLTLEIEYAMSYLVWILSAPQRSHEKWEIIDKYSYSSQIVGTMRILDILMSRIEKAKKNSSDIYCLSCEKSFPAHRVEDLVNDWHVGIDDPEDLYQNINYGQDILNYVEQIIKAFLEPTPHLLTDRLNNK